MFVQVLVTWSNVNPDKFHTTEKLFLLGVICFLFPKEQSKSTKDYLITGSGVAVLLVVWKTLKIRKSNKFTEVNMSLNKKLTKISSSQCIDGFTWGHIGTEGPYIDQVPDKSVINQPFSQLTSLSPILKPSKGLINLVVPL